MTTVMLDRDRARRVVEHDEVVRETAAPVDDLTEAEMLAAARQGLVYGIPITYLVVVAVCLLAVPGEWPLVVVAVWPALFGGGFFGGIVGLGVRGEMARRRMHASRSIRSRPTTRWHVRPHVPAH